MVSQGLRRTEATGSGFKRGHVGSGQRTGSDRVVAQQLLKRVYVLFGNEHSVSAVLRRR